MSQLKRVSRNRRRMLEVNNHSAIFVVQWIGLMVSASRADVVILRKDVWDLNALKRNELIRSSILARRSNSKVCRSRQRSSMIFTYGNDRTLQSFMRQMLSILLGGRKNP